MKFITISDITNSTLKLIEDLREEISRYEKIRLLFPDSYKVNHKELSKIWGWKDQTFVYRGLRRGKFAELNKLKNNLNEKFGDLAKPSIQVIKEYEDHKLQSSEFIEKLCNELSMLPKGFVLNDQQLSRILINKWEGRSKYISNLLARIKNNNNIFYNPQFKFSIEKLIEFKENIRNILGNDAEKCIEIIDIYCHKNKDLKLYSQQKFEIKNPNFFKEIDTKEKFYWFEFLQVDKRSEGPPNYRIGIKLSIKDNKIARRFAKAVGFDIKRIKNIKENRKYKDRLKSFKYVSVRFGCKIMYQDLFLKHNLTLSNSDPNIIRVPKVVKKEIFKAKLKAKQLNIHWFNTESGKNALTWLLGYFDGDGQYVKSGWFVAKIFSSSRNILEEIKKSFESPNKVRLGRRITLTEEQKSRGTIGECWYLTLGPELYKAMLEAYPDSLLRKRHPDY